MENINILFDNLLSIFLTSFNFVKSINCNYREEKKINKNENGSFLKIFIVDKNTNIQYQLYYHYEDYIVFSIINDTNEFKYIAFDSFLKFKGYEKDNLLSLNKMKGKDIPEKFKNYCDYVVRILETDLKGVVEGKEWIDMPIDWMGYK